MSRTHKTNPWFVRENRGQVTQNHGASHLSWRERGSGPKGVRFAKKEARRARRRGLLSPVWLKSLRTTTKYTSS